MPAAGREHPRLHCLTRLSYHTELVQEYQCYAYGTDETHAEEIDSEERGTQRAPVGKLLLHHTARHKPSEKYAREEATDGQKHLTCDEIEHIEKRFSAYLQAVCRSERERTEHAYNAARHRDKRGGTTARDAEFFAKECRGDLMQRNKRSEGGKTKQRIEQQCNAPNLPTAWWQRLAGTRSEA